jgi:hypothetical protein
MDFYALQAQMNSMQPQGHHLKTDTIDVVGVTYRTPLPPAIRWWFISSTTSRVAATTIAFSAILAAIYLVRLRNLNSFNADECVQIVMAKYFSGASVDFYFWGQNRLGSFIPVLLIIPIKLLDLPPLASAVALSTTLYLGFILILTRYCVSAVETLLLALAFAALPAEMYEYLLYTGHPYASLMFLSAAAFSLLFPPGNVDPATLSRWRFLAAGLIAGVAFWVTETAATAVASLVLVAYWRRGSFNLSSDRILAFGVGLAVLFPLILYWRHQIGYHGHDAEYLRVASPSEIVIGLGKFFTQMTDLINSEGYQKPWTANTAGAVMIGVTIIALVARLNRTNSAALVKWLGTFNLIYFLIVVLAHHSYYGQGQIQRFWTAPIMSSIALCILLPFELLRTRRHAFAGTVAAASVVCMISLSHLLVLRTPGTAPSEQVALFQRLHAMGAHYVMGDFWDVLPLNVVSRFEMVAAPPDFTASNPLRPRFAQAQKIFIVLNEDLDMRPEHWKPYVLIPTSDPGIVVATKE